MASEHIKAARALLRIEQSELARRAHVSVVTIRRAEAAEGSERLTPLTVQSIRRALEEAGAEFIPGGVRRRSQSRGDQNTLFDDLREISLRSAAALQGQEVMTEADLYDEDGLPA